MLSILLLATAILASGQSLAVGAVLPQLSGETLDGKPRALPAAAQGKIAFLTIAFSKRAGEHSRTWSERFSRDERPPANVTNYSIAMLEGVPRLLRGMIKSGIKRGVPAHFYDRFLIVTSEQAAWEKYLAVKDRDLPYLVVIDGEGRLQWKDQGAFDEEKYRELRTRIAALQQP